MDSGIKCDNMVITTFPHAQTGVLMHTNTKHGLNLSVTTSIFQLLFKDIVAVTFSSAYPHVTLSKERMFDGMNNHLDLTATCDV